MVEEKDTQIKTNEQVKEEGQRIKYKGNEEQIEVEIVNKETSSKTSKANKSTEEDRVEYSNTKTWSNQTKRQVKECNNVV